MEGIIDKACRRDGVYTCSSKTSKKMPNKKGQAALIGALLDILFDEDRRWPLFMGLYNSLSVYNSSLDNPLYLELGPDHVQVNCS